MNSPNDRREKKHTVVHFQALSLDGGGIRGAFGVGLIAEFERILGQPVTDYFDLVAGTSTGAITGAGISNGKSGEELVEFYKEYGRKIFTPREPYQPKGWVKFGYPLVKSLLEKRTGQKFDDFFCARYCPIALEAALVGGMSHAKMADLIQSRFIVPAVNLSLGQTCLFRTPHLPDRQNDRDLRIVDVLIAATAAPTYFPHKILPDGHAYCDGGLWAINPSILAIAEAMKVKQMCVRQDCDPNYDTSDIRVLSIGTGAINYSLSPPGSDAGIIFWAQHVADVMGNSQVQGVETPMNFFLGERYHSINFDMPDATWELDNTDLIDDLLRLGREMAGQQFDRIAPMFFDVAKPNYVAYGE